MSKICATGPACSSFHDALMLLAASLHHRSFSFSSSSVLYIHACTMIIVITWVLLYGLIWTNNIQAIPNYYLWHDTFLNNATQRSSNIKKHNHTKPSHINLNALILVHSHMLKFWLGLQPCTTVIRLRNKCETVFSHKQYWNVVKAWEHWWTPANVEIYVKQGIPDRKIWSDHESTLKNTRTMMHFAAKVGCNLQ